MVTEQHLQLGTLFQHDEHTTVDHQVHIRAQDVDYLYSTVYLDVLGHIDVETILRQHRIKVGGSIVSLTSQTVVVFSGGKIL